MNAATGLCVSGCYTFDGINFATCNSCKSQHILTTTGVCVSHISNCLNYDAKSTLVSCAVCDPAYHLATIS